MAGTLVTGLPKGKTIPVPEDFNPKGEEESAGTIGKKNQLKEAL